MDDLTGIVDFDKIHSYQTEPYYKRIRFREESDLIHYHQAEKIIDETSQKFLEKELTKIHLNQLFSETKKILEKSAANPREPTEYINEKTERIKLAREAGNQYSRYNAIPTSRKENQKPILSAQLQKKVNPLVMKAKIYGKMVSNENRKKYDAKPKVFKPSMTNVKRILKSKPRNRLTEYGHYYSIRNRLLYKEEIEEFDNEFTELLLECVLFEKDHLDVQGYLEEKLRLHQFEIPKCARKQHETETETEIELERKSNKSSINEVCSDVCGFDSVLDVPIVSKASPIKRNIGVKPKSPRKNDSFLKNYYDLIDEAPEMNPCDTSNINKNNNKLIILKSDADAKEIILTDNKTNINDEKIFEDMNENNENKIINVKISNVCNINNTNNNIKIEENNIMSNIDNINKNVIEELEINTSENVENTTKNRSSCEISAVPSVEKNDHIADDQNDFNLELTEININAVNADNTSKKDNNNNINSTIINVNTIYSKYIPERTASKADTSTSYHSTNSVSFNPNNVMINPKDLFEKIIIFNSVGVHTDNINTSNTRLLPMIDEESEHNEQSCWDSLSPVQSFMSLPPPPSETELKSLESLFIARSRDHSPEKSTDINCGDSENKNKLENISSKDCKKPDVKVVSKDHFDKNFVKYMKFNKSTNEDDIAMENYMEEYELSGCESLNEKFQSILSK